MTMRAGRRAFLAGGTAAFLAGIADIRTGLAASTGARAGTLPDRADYLIDPAVSYLNHASVGTMSRAVHAAHLGYLGLCERNPWLHIFGGEWEAPREQVRARAAAMFGTSAGRIAITHNTTEAFNLLALGLPLGPGDEVLFSDLNHDGASVPFLMQARLRGFEVRRFALPVAEAASMSAAELVEAHLAAIGPPTRLLVLPHIDNIVGIRHPVREIAAGARARGVEFLAVDGAQSAGVLDLALDTLGVDLYAMSGHKWLQAPKGIGLAFIGEALAARLQPMWTTWGQQRWSGTVRMFEDYGTRNMAEVLTLGDALDVGAAIDPAARRSRLSSLRRQILERVDAEPDLDWHSPRDAERGCDALVSIGFRSEPAQASFRRLYGEAGFVFRPFSEPLDMMRLSPNLMTTDDEITSFFDHLLG